MNASTPQQIAAQTKAACQASRARIERGACGRTLTVTAPERCPPMIADAIKRHNGRAADLAKAEARVDAAMAALPSRMTDPREAPDRLAAEAGRLRAERFGLLRERLVVIESRERILADLLRHLDGVAVTVGEEYTRIRRNAKGDGDPKVVKALARIEAIRNAILAAKGCWAATATDLAVTGQELLQAWRSLVGPLP